MKKFAAITSKFERLIGNYAGCDHLIMFWDDHHLNYLPVTNLPLLNSD